MSHVDDCLSRTRESNSAPASPRKHGILRQPLAEHHSPTIIGSVPSLPTHRVCHKSATKFSRKPIQTLGTHPVLAPSKIVCETDRYVMDLIDDAICQVSAPRKRVHEEMCSFVTKIIDSATRKLTEEDGSNKSTPDDGKIKASAQSDCQPSAGKICSDLNATGFKKTTPPALMQNYNNNHAHSENLAITPNMEKECETNVKIIEDCDTNHNESESCFSQTPPKRIKLCKVNGNQEKDSTDKINRLKKKVSENKEKLRKLKLAKTYKTKHRAELDELIKKWRRASQDALVELTEHAEENVTIGDILNHYNIDHKLVRYNPNKGIFEDRHPPE